MVEVAPAYDHAGLEGPKGPKGPLSGVFVLSVWAENHDVFFV